MRKDGAVAGRALSTDPAAPKASADKPIPAKKTPRTYPCPVCGRTFLFANDVRKHMRIHSNERPYPCPECDQRFRQAGCLKNHVASQHGSSETFTCFYCAKTFPIKERLRLHMRIHSGVKPYKCQACGHAFSRGGQLKQHMNAHIECREKLKSGTQGKRLPNADGPLRAERKSNESANGMSCEFCAETFARRLMLKKHTKECSQRPSDQAKTPKTNDEAQLYYACDMCEASFMHQSQLRAHKRVHSGDRLYKCKVCSSSFAHLNVLKMHFRKHTGEKPFRCAICPNNTFSQLPHLKTHMRTIHKMDKSYHCAACNTFYKMKHEYEQHASGCQRAANGSTTADRADDPAAERPMTKEQSVRLTQMRLCMAVLLKRITSVERLKQLGFEKVLIDNVITAALKQAKQPHQLPGDDEGGSNEFDRFAVNVRHFLAWTLPPGVLDRFESDSTNVADLLHKLTKCD